MKKLESIDYGKIYEIRQTMTVNERRRQARHCLDRAEALDLHPRKTFASSVKRLRLMAEILTEGL